MFSRWNLLLRHKISRPQMSETRLPLLFSFFIVGPAFNLKAELNLKPVFILRLFIHHYYHILHPTYFSLLK